ncbi:MAG: hypothetical protein WC575_00020 [Patescibacteria group bacterium]
MINNKISGIPEQEFKLGYWFFIHRDLFKKVIISLLLLIILSFGGYGIIGLIRYLATTRAYNQMLVSLTENNVDTSFWKIKNKAEEIQVIKVQAIALGQTYDLVAEIKNPNLRWSVTSLDYRFLVDGQELATGSSFILPLEEKYITAYNIRLNNNYKDISLVITENRWQRLRDFKEFPILNFIMTGQQVEDINLTSQGAQQGTRLAIDLTNRSAYSFWQVNITALLKSGNEIMAVASKAITSMESGQTQTVEFFWPQSYHNISEVIIKPEVNVLDPEVFKPLTSNPVNKSMMDFTACAWERYLANAKTAIL